MRVVGVWYIHYIIVIEDNHIGFTWFCVMVITGIGSQKMHGCLVNVIVCRQWNVLRNMHQFSSVYYICVCQFM